MKLISGLAAVALATTVLAQPAAVAATPAQAADAAADWIVGELVDGVVIGDYGPDAGSGIDAGLALEAVGRDADALEIASGLSSLLVSTNDPYKFGYVKSSEYDYPADSDPVYLREGYYANATAKAAAFVERLGADASMFYDIDLVDQLETLTDDTTGRISDDSSYTTDYANSIGQGFAVEALTAAGSSEAASATGRLLARQCDSGFFPLGLDAPCPASELHPDVTSLVLISLVESGLTTPEVATAIKDAADWLESVQLPNGSFPGDGGAAGANVNGTGLAGWALGAAGRTASAGQAAAWVRGLQVADAGACASAAPNGAIAFNAPDLADARRDGLGLKRTTWRFATFQATPALMWAPSASGSLSVSTPATASDAGTVTATVSGLAAGEYGCVSLGSNARLVKGDGGVATADFQLPAGAGTYTFNVRTLTESKSSTTTVPAPVASTPTPTQAPAPTPTVGDLAATKVERVRNNRFTVVVSCDGTEPCAGKIKVRTKRTLERADGTSRRLLVAKATYSADPDRSARITLKLTKAARKALGDGRLRVVATQTARGAEPADAAFWLRRK